MDDCHLAASGLMIWRSEGRIPQGRVTVRGRVRDLLPFDGRLLLLYIGCSPLPRPPPTAPVLPRSRCLPVHGKPACFSRTAVCFSSSCFFPLKEWHFLTSPEMLASTTLS